MTARNKPPVCIELGLSPGPPGRNRRNFVRVLVSYRALLRARAFQPKLACRAPRPGGAISPAMFVVTEGDAAAIRAVFDQEGELSAALELRRRFPGITDNAKARACARTIAGWTPPPASPCSVTRRPPGSLSRSDSHSPGATEASMAIERAG